MREDNYLVVVESSVWVDYLAQNPTPETAWVQAHLDKGVIAIVDLILCEVLQGIRNDRLYRETLRDLSEFSVLETGGPEIAIKAAENYRLLRKKGVTIRTTIDCLIATFCIRQGYPLLHSDRDFDPFEQHLGLKVIHPPALLVQ